MNHNFEIIETKEQPVLSIRTITSVDKLPQELGKAYNSIISYLNDVGAQPRDTAFARNIFQF